jgi:hypothetical protein
LNNLRVVAAFVSNARRRGGSASPEDDAQNQSPKAYYFYGPLSGAQKMFGGRAAFHQRVEDNAFHRTTVTQLPRRNDQPCPPCKETKAADGSNSTEPSKIRQRHEIQAPAEKEDPGEKQPPSAAIDRP